jgi:G:T-mismatch repair DNA endonuclease (very short patch repair protein)
LFAQRDGAQSRHLLYRRAIENHECGKKCWQFWQRKLAANRARDALVTRMLRRAGWRVVRVWEHELARKHQARLLNRIRKVLAPREDRASRRVGRACIAW